MSRTDRTAHVLRPEKTLTVPRHVIFFDTETDFDIKPNGDTTHKLSLGWACYYRRGEGRRVDTLNWLFFTDNKSFWQFVLNYSTNKNRLWVIAHNISFDFTVMKGWTALRRAGFKLKFFYTNSGTTIIKVKAKGKSILFIDSLNWFKESLEKLGERLGVPKLSINFETASFSYKKAYCKRDVEILLTAFRALVAYLREHHISRLCYTLGSTAFAAYLFGHYHKHIFIHNDVTALRMERAAYAGGRTECFYIGSFNHGPYFVVDINSLYPYVMRNNQFPTKYVQVIHNPLLSEFSSLCEKYVVVAEVQLKTPDPVYPLKDKRTIFPTGNFSTVLCTPEIIYAYAHRHIVSIGTMVLYEGNMIFTSFVDKFYKLRSRFKDNNNPLFDHFTKLLMNSLYGKFGQKAEQWTKIGNCPDEPDRIEDVIDIETHRRRRLRYLLGEIFELTGHTESFNSFPAIAAHVTAYARLYLWTLMQTAGPGNYYYCDTDSLFLNQAGYNNLRTYCHDSELGKLKLERVTNSMTIRGLKDYDLDDKHVVKGVRKKAERISDNVYRQEQWPSFASILRTTTPEVYQTHLVEKHLTRTYTKGVVTPAGVVVPFELDV